MPRRRFYQNDMLCLPLALTGVLARLDPMPSPKLIRCRAILFDLDGVLVDSTAQIEEQWREWAVGRGLDPVPFVRYCHGRRAVETIRLAAPELDAEWEVAQFKPARDESAGHFTAMPGALALLAKLPVERWAIVTSGRLPSVMARIEQAELPRPRVLVTAEDVGRGKPDPEGYLLAATRLAVDPLACVIIEDAPPGVQAARAAGISSIAVLTTYKADALMDADERVRSLEEIGATVDHDGITLALAATTVAVP